MEKERRAPRSGWESEPGSSRGAVKCANHDTIVIRDSLREVVLKKLLKRLKYMSPVFPILHIVITVNS